VNLNIVKGPSRRVDLKGARFGWFKGSVRGGETLLTRGGSELRDWEKGKLQKKGKIQRKLQ